MFDGDLIAGPVPTMFAEDPEVTKEALKADIYRAHFDMAKLLHGQKADPWDILLQQCLYS
jgi:hypothetical protein